MNYSIGDGMAVLGVAGGIVGYFYVTHQTRQKRMELIHQERLAAMEKGIPLPELPIDPPPGDGRSDPDDVVPILGTVLLTLSVGAMVVLNLNLRPDQHGLWIAPLPFAFLGVGLLAYHFLKGKSGR